MTKQELEKKYEGKKIGEIEAEIGKNQDLSFDAQKRMTLALSYLRITNRYKENPQYKNSTFETYLKGQFNMRLGTFLEKERAIIRFPEEAKKYGIGLVAKVKRVVGAKKESAVFKEIKESQGKLPIKQAKIEAIIQKYAPAKEKKAPAVNWKMKYDLEVLAHMETKTALQTAKAQIEKLKATVLELRPLRDMKAAIMPFMMESAEPINPRLNFKG